MLNVWIGNLGKYNEGELIGEWLELPVSKKELNTFLKEKVGLQLTQAEVEKALAEDGVCYEEYMINDYETDLPIRVSEYSNLMMLNLLAMSSERVNNMEAVEAYIEYQGIYDIEEIINVMLQEDEIPFYPYEPTYENLSNGEKYGISKAIWSGLDEILEKYEVDTIVIGRPINMNGTESERTEITDKFIHKLKCKYNTLKIETIDERLTTVAAHKTMNLLDVNKYKKKNIVDTISAVYILETYLNKIKVN